MKRCPQCATIKPFEDFHRASRTKDKCQTRCKPCYSSWARANRSKIVARQKTWRDLNKEHVTEVDRAYRDRNKERLHGRHADWVENNRAHIAQYQRDRRTTDNNFRLSQNIRNRLGKALNNGQRAGSAIADLGCTIDALREHLQGLFYSRESGETMTWSNYGHAGWHIDHVRPLASFDLTDREQFLQACNYTNLQPLWAEENIAKGDRYPSKSSADSGTQSSSTETIDSVLSGDPDT